MRHVEGIATLTAVFLKTAEIEGTMCTPYCRIIHCNLSNRSFVCREKKLTNANILLFELKFLD